jgi:hypothetical protein
MAAHHVQRRQLRRLSHLYLRLRAMILSCGVARGPYYCLQLECYLCPPGYPWFLLAATPWLGIWSLGLIVCFPPNSFRMS